jgi:hypothetical protein
MVTVDRQTVHAPLERVFQFAADVETWPAHLAHYRFVRFESRDGAGGGLVTMSANRPFGPVNWPTWWASDMEVRRPGSSGAPVIRFRHVRGITTGMEVEWQFRRSGDATDVTILHMWNGPRWPVIGGIAATMIIGPVFVHGIASRTLAGLARAAAR